MRRTATDIYNYARAAGLSVADSVIAVAVALAESSGDDDVLGDVHLQTSVWGPSVGIWQIRTLKAETGQGTDRDINALKGNPARQAQAMANISKQGKNWSPWTVYNTGSYEQYLGQAQNAAKGVGDTTAPISYTVPVPTAGKVLSGVKTLGLQLTGAALGLVLIGGGLVLAISPTARRATGAALNTAKGAVGL